MSLVVPDQGENIILEVIVNKTPPQDPLLKLFTNDVTPGESDTEATYTEASGYGYGAKALTGANWNPASGGSISHPQQIFTFTGPLGNVYGYYIVQATSGKLIWVERFAGAPYNIQNNGDEIKITPTITAS